MPSRNVIKQDLPDTYYHIYARGIGKSPVFTTDSGRDFMLGLLARYLSRQPANDRNGLPYPHFGGKVELLAYCLMQNHFHLLIYQKEQGAMPHLMQCLMTSYTRQFNRWNDRSGPLFESRYKASDISSPNYLEHISRYIHLNPRYWQRYRYSSAGYYRTGRAPEWLTIGPILEMFDSTEDYWKFLEDYEDTMRMWDEIKHDLAT